MSYTKGKWGITKVGYPKDREFWITNNQNVVAKIDNSVLNENSKDDAALISAAPDMLAALRGLLDMITDNRLHGKEIDAALLAIDKAEGE